MPWAEAETRVRNNTATQTNKYLIKIIDILLTSDWTMAKDREEDLIFG